MTPIIKIVSYIGLALTIVPSVLFFNDAMSLDAMKTSMTIGMLCWLVAAPLAQRTKDATK